MRRPMDFWKGLVRPYYHPSNKKSDGSPASQVLAQIVIVMAYILFGCFVYVRIQVLFIESYRHETFTGIPRAIYTTLSIPGCE